METMTEHSTEPLGTEAEDKIARLASSMAAQLGQAVEGLVEVVGDQASAALWLEDDPSDDCVCIAVDEDGYLTHQVTIKSATG